MEIIPDKRKLIGLVEQANDGRLCLPDFQRDFVWTREQVSDLLRSVVRGFFIGTLLLLRCDPQSPPFAPTFVRGARPHRRDAHPELLALDGQQRLSSMLYALLAPNFPLKDTSHRRWFYLDLNLLLEDSDNDAIVFDRSPAELNGLLEADAQYDRRALPFTALLKPEDFMRWRDGLDDWLRAQGDSTHREFRERWRQPWTDAATNFQTFEVPLVELPKVDEGDPDSIGRVCAIFEKLNSTGTDLSIYDLLTARLYRYGIRLHDLWEETVGAHHRLARWSGGRANNNKFGVLLLRVLALRRGLEVKPKTLINLAPENFREDWMRAGAAMEKALELVEHVGPDGFGVFDKKWLPGYALLPVLAALRADVDQRKLGVHERADVRHWYWSNVFLERYSSAVESKSRKDYAELLGYWAGGRVPDVFKEADARLGSPNYAIRDAASFASALYSGVFCLLAIRGARDWRRGEAIQLQQLQDHHVFPQAYLKRRGIVAKNAANTIVNRTLISDETNQRISDRAPADYIDDADVFPRAAGETLEPHFISDRAIEAMRQASSQLEKELLSAIYDEFLRDRERAVVEEIRRAAGVGSYPVEVETDEEADEEGQDIHPTTDGATPTKQLQFEFWKGLAEFLRSERTPLNIRRPGFQHWYNFTVGHAGSLVSLTVNTREQELACKFYIRSADARELFAKLLQSRSAIESGLGAELEWDMREGRRRCQVVQRRSGDIRDRAAWPEYFGWLKERAEAFAQVFGPRVSKL